jgi:cytochrome c-type biogenesis protein CcmE
MAQATWEKTASAEKTLKSRGGTKLKLAIGGLLILAAVGYLIVSGTASGARYFITVDELKTNAKYVGQTVRITGAVIGETIKYDPSKLLIEFTIANVADNPQDLGQALHDAVGDPKATRLQVRVENQVKPDLLKNEAQAILTGKLGPDGVFVADELLLKCPSRYGEEDPNKSIADPAKTDKSQSIADPGKSAK